MGFKYEVNGQLVEFEKEPTEKDIDEAAASLKASAPKIKEKEKSTMEKFTEPLKSMSMSDWSKNSLLAPTLRTMTGVTPFGLMKPQFGAQQMQQGSQQLGNKLVEMGQGLYNAVTNPAETAQNIYNAVTERPAETAGNVVKGAIYDPELMLPVGKAAQAAGTVVKEGVAAPVNLATGVARGVAYPKGTAPNSALLPIRPTYVPHEQVAAFQRGEIPASQLTEMPTQPLVEKNTATSLAYGMAPENAQGQKLVPAQGRIMQGIGENIGSGLRTNPVQGLVDVGGLVTGIGPVYSMAKAIPAAGSAMLSKATGFDPKFGGQRAAALQAEQQAAQQARMQAGSREALQPNRPLALPAPTTGPVAPPIYVAPEGIAGTNINQVSQAGAMSKYPSMPAQTPKQISQQVAASKIQPQPTATPQAIPQPMPQAIPQPQPPKMSSKELNKQMDTVDRQMSELHEANVGRVDPNTIEGEAYRNQLGNMYQKFTDLQKQYEAALKAEKEADKLAKKAQKKRDLK